MKNHWILLLYFVFILYYMFTLYVFNSLQKNPCNCAKLEKFKKTWNFKYVIVASSLLLLFNFYLLRNLLHKIQKGGSIQTILNYTIILFCIGYGISFLNDYAILDLFSTMTSKECPCSVDKRNYLTNATKAKFLVNLIIFVTSLFLLNTNKFKKRIVQKMNDNFKKLIKLSIKKQK